MTQVLVVEDDPATAAEISAALHDHGYQVSLAGNGRDGLVRALSESFAVIVLDRMLPGGMDGLAMLTALRSAGVETPVLILSALSDLDERVRGLRAGGDDYLTKPFAPDEMAARVEVLLRRREAARDTRLRVGDLELDLVAREARRGGVALDLLPTEFRLLEFLVRNSGQVLTRTMIFEAVWGYHFDPGTNVIDVHIARLRRKVDTPDRGALIRTVRGKGYLLGPG